jgi:hypothetical protein
MNLMNRTARNSDKQSNSKLKKSSKLKFVNTKNNSISNSD